MKKALIIALISVLLIGTFVACDGDVFADLMDKAPEATTITLVIPSFLSGHSFDSSDTSVTTKTVEVPSGCETWAEFLAEVTDIKVYYPSYSDVIYTLTNYDGKVYFKYNDYLFGLELVDSKTTGPDTVDATAEIVIGGTYQLTAEKQ